MDALSHHSNALCSLIPYVLCECFDLVALGNNCLELDTVAFAVFLDMLHYSPNLVTSILGMQWFVCQNPSECLNCHVSFALFFKLLQSAAIRHSAKLQSFRITQLPFFRCTVQYSMRCTFRFESLAALAQYIWCLYDSHCSGCFHRYYRGSMKDN